MHEKNEIVNNIDSSHQITGVKQRSECSIQGRGIILEQQVICQM